MIQFDLYISNGLKPPTRYIFCLISGRDKDDTVDGWGRAPLMKIIPSFTYQVVQVIPSINVTDGVDGCNFATGTINDLING